MMTGWLQYFASKICATFSAWREKNSTLKGYRWHRVGCMGINLCNIYTKGKQASLCGTDGRCLIAEVKVRIAD